MTRKYDEKYTHTHTFQNREDPEDVGYHGHKITHPLKHAAQLQPSALVVDATIAVID